jgi:GNAT superfamily N-acetyltransferase
LLQQNEVSHKQRRLERLRRAGSWYDIREMLTKDDLYILEPLFRKAHFELVPNQVFSMEAIFRHAEYKLSDPERMTYNGWAAYREGEPVGFFIGGLSSYFISTDKYAISSVWYVDKQYRGSPVAFLLVKQFLTWGALRGCTRFIIDIIRDEHSDKQVKLFAKMSQKLGFREAGAYFVKDVDNAASMDDQRSS